MGENVCHTGLAAWVQAREPTERRRGSINSTRLHSYPHIHAMPLMPLHSHTYTCTTIIFEEANWRASLNYTYHVSWRSYYFNFEQELGWVLFSIVLIIYIINQQCCILENTHRAAGKCSREGAAILTLSLSTLSAPSSHVILARCFFWISVAAFQAERKGFCKLRLTKQCGLILSSLCLCMFHCGTYSLSSWKDRRAVVNTKNQALHFWNEDQVQVGSHWEIQLITSCRNGERTNLNYLLFWKPV